MTLTGSFYRVKVYNSLFMASRKGFYKDFTIQKLRSRGKMCIIVSKLKKSFQGSGKNRKDSKSCENSNTR